MINKIEAVNYRCLRNVSQPLDRFHVIAGPNGSGKSTFLEVVKVLGAFASDGLDSVFAESKAQRLEELFFRGMGYAFQLAVEMQVPDAVLDSLKRKNGERKRFVRYEVDIDLGTRVAPAPSHEAGEPRISSEKLWLIDKPTEFSRQELVQEELKFPSRSVVHRDLIHGQNKTPTGWRQVAGKSSEQNAYFKSETSKWNFTLKPGKRRSALSSLPEDERFGIANWAKQSLTRGVHKLMLRSEAMQGTCGPLKEKTFKPDGSTLPLVVQKLRDDENRFRGWLAHVQTILPIKDIEIIERPEDKNTYLRVAYDSGVSVPSWHLSDGTLRMLALTLLPYIESEGITYLIEEPENGVHPPAVEAIYKSLSSIYDGQALIATHSPVLVGLIEPKQLLCFSRTQEGETDIIRGDKHPRLLKWQKDFQLAQLFASGVLG
jgi:predicted ATPase